MSQPSAWCPPAPSPASPPVTDLEPRGGGGRGSGIQRPAPRWGQEVSKGEGTTTEGLGVADLPYSISQPGLGSGEGGRGYFWAAVPHLAPGGSLAGSGAEQAGGIFILEQHCRGGWLGSCLSRQLLRERTRGGCQSSPRARGAGPGSPGPRQPQAGTGSFPGGV